MLAGKKHPKKTILVALHNTTIETTILQFSFLLLLALPLVLLLCLDSL
jgi:hypothetical protein